MPLLQFLRSNARWLLAGLLLAFASSFGQTFFISVFAGDIRREFGLSNGGWGGIYALGTMSSAAVMLVAGGLTDRFRVRDLGVVIVVALAMACLAMALVSTLWALPFVVFALRFTGQGMTSHVSSVAMARWFVATRGRALAIASLGFAFGEAFLPLTYVALLRYFSWRSLWVFSALLVLLIIVPLLAFLRHERSPRTIEWRRGSCFWVVPRHCRARRSRLPFWGPRWGQARPFSALSGLNFTAAATLARSGRWPSPSWCLGPRSDPR